MTFYKTWLLIASILFIVVLITGFTFFRQRSYLKAQLKAKNEFILEQTRLIDETRKGSKQHLLSNVLDSVSEDLKANGEGKLSAESITSIRDISDALEPFQYLEGDSLSHRKFSPGRGQLLIALKNMKIDPASYAKIRYTTSFAFADLTGANLSKANLEKLNLSKAIFKETDLRKADLDSVNLKNAVLWGANLRSADLRYADLQGADFSWSNLNEASIRHSNLNDVIMISARLKKADISHVSLRAGNLDRALLVEANLYKTDLAATSLKKASFAKADLRESKLKYCDLSQADFSYADMRNANLLSVNLTEAIFTGAQLDGVLVDGKDWFEKLEAWNISGLDEVKAKYQIVRDSIQSSVFKIEKRDTN